MDWISIHSNYWAITLTVFLCLIWTKNVKIKQLTKASYVLRNLCVVELCNIDVFLCEASWATWFIMVSYTLSLRQDMEWSLQFWNLFYLTIDLYINDIFSYLLLTLYTYPIYVTSPWTIIIEYGIFHKYSYDNVCGHFWFAMMLTSCLYAYHLLATKIIVLTQYFLRRPTF